MHNTISGSRSVDVDEATGCGGGCKMNVVAEAAVVEVTVRTSRGGGLTFGHTSIVGCIS